MAICISIQADRRNQKKMSTQENNIEIYPQ